MDRSLMLWRPTGNWIQGAYSLFDRPILTDDMAIGSRPLRGEQKSAIVDNVYKRRPTYPFSSNLSHRLWSYRYEFSANSQGRERK